MSVKVKDNNLDFALRRLKTEVARNEKYAEYLREHQEWAQARLDEAQKTLERRHKKIALY